MRKTGARSKERTHPCPNRKDGPSAKLFFGCERRGRQTVDSGCMEVWLARAQARVPVLLWGLACILGKCGIQLLFWRLCWFGVFRLWVLL